MAMLYNYGRTMATPNFPYWGYAGLGGFGPWLGVPGAYGPVPGMGAPSWGYGTFPGVVPPFGGYGPFPAAAPWYAPTYVPRSDDEIRDFVQRTIASDPMIPSDASIDVTVSNGVVTLTGTVPSKRIKHAAGDDAWWVPSVLDVHNEIEITPRR